MPASGMGIAGLLAGISGGQGIFQRASAAPPSGRLCRMGRERICR